MASIMFCIAVRLVGDSSPGQPAINVEPLPSVNKTFPLAMLNPRTPEWVFPDPDMAPTTFNRLEDAQKALNSIAGGISRNEEKVKLLVQRIHQFIKPYAERNLFHRADLEILHLTSETIVVKPIFNNL